MSTDVVDRLNAALEGRYRVEGELGQGGMATVYLADDLKHERRVAVKVLRPELAAMIGADRFLAEIKTTAGLQHPHILPLFDSGEADGFLYYVMPYVEGESLRARLAAERQLDVDEAVRMARAVASALAYAHESGVIHRDIKPENILLHAGEPVVADFGIALAISAAGGGRMTETGLSLGTPHYMSPEQASADRDLSARSDVYSLGCVLYEMLAGQPPHTGPSAQSILVRILTEEPRPLTELRRTVPPNVAAAVAKAIEKLPADRFRSAEEFRAALDDTAFRWEPSPAGGGGSAGGGTTGTEGGTPGATEAAAGSPGAHPAFGAAHPRRRAILAAVMAAALFAASTTWLALDRWTSRARAVRAAPVISFVMLDSAETIVGPYVGADGSVAYIDRGAIWLRAPGSLEAVRVEGTDGAQAASFSPDAGWLAFAVGASAASATELKKVPSVGGPVVTLMTTEQPVLGRPVWGADGWIYVNAFGQASASVLRVPEIGGPPDTLVVTGARQSYDPVPLPGGRGLVYTSFSGAGAGAHLVALDFATGDTVAVVLDGFSARWSPTGHLVYTHGSGALFAVPFDPRALRPTGPPAPVQDGVGSLAGIIGRFDLSPTGTLAYVASSALGLAGLVGFTLVDPDGGVERLPLEPSDHWDADLSPDGARLAYTRGGHVWIYDLDLGGNRQLTTVGDDHHNPVWSPDGKRVLFLSSRAEGPGIYVQAADGSTPPELVAEVVGVNPSQWLADGTVLLTGDLGDVYRMSLEGGSGVAAFMQADWRERAPAVSPDGRWIAYMSAEAGALQLWLRTWPDLQQKTLISDADAVVADLTYPVWSPDGTTLYYQVGSEILAAELETGGDGVRVRARRRIELGVPAVNLQSMHPDGRLLVLTPGGAPAGSGTDPARLIVVTNWLAQLQARLGGGA